MKRQRLTAVLAGVFALSATALVAFVLSAHLPPGTDEEAPSAVLTPAAAGVGLTLPSPAPLGQVVEAVPAESGSEAVARAAAPKGLQTWSEGARAPSPEEHTPTYLLALLCAEEDPLVLSLLAEELGARAEELSPEQVQLVERLAREEPLAARRVAALMLLGRLPLTPGRLETIVEACAAHQQVQLRLAGYAALNDVAAEQPRFADQVDGHLSLLAELEHDPVCRRAAEAARDFEANDKLVTAALRSRGKTPRRH